MELSYLSIMKWQSMVWMANNETHEVLMSPIPLVPRPSRFP
jgi:hypothetical protein